MHKGEERCSHRGLRCCRLEVLMAGERGDFERRCADFGARRDVEVARVRARQALVRRVLEAAAVPDPMCDSRCRAAHPSRPGLSSCWVLVMAVGVQVGTLSGPGGSMDGRSLHLGRPRILCTLCPYVAPDMPLDQGCCLGTHGSHTMPLSRGCTICMCDQFAACCRWVSLPWLRQWADSDAGDAIDNAPIVCLHGKLDPARLAGQPAQPCSSCLAAGLHNALW